MTWGRDEQNNMAYEPEAILKKQVQRGKSHFLVKWQGQSTAEASWVTEEALRQAGFEWLMAPLNQPDLW
mgnify:FL=1